MQPTRQIGLQNQNWIIQDPFTRIGSFKCASSAFFVLYDEQIMAEIFRTLLR